MPIPPATWLEKFAIQPTAADKDDPFVIQLDNGNIVMLYEVNSDGADDDIRGQMFDPAGNRLGAEFAATGLTYGDQDSFSAAALPGGKFVIVYEQYFNGATTLRSTIWSTTDTGVTGASNDLLATGTDSIYYDNLSVTALSGGRFAVAYSMFEDRSNYDVPPEDFEYQPYSKVLARIFSASGVMGGEFTALPEIRGYDSDVTLATLNNGNFVLLSAREVYTDTYDGPRDLVQRIFTDNAGAVTGQQVVASGGGEPSVAILSGGGYAIGWDIDVGTIENTVARTYYDSGVARSPAVTVSTANSDEVQIAGLSDGNFAAFYAVNDDTGFRLKVYTPSGQQLGAETTIDTGAPLYDDPHLTALADGRFVVAYAVEDADFNYQIFAQILDPRDAPNATPAYTEPTIVGTVGNDTIETPDLFGGRIYGGAGNDLIIAERNLFNGDYYDGGSGIDTIDFRALTASNPTFNLLTEEVIFGGPQEFIVGIENLIGTPYSDTIIGSNGSNILNGSAGDDSIDGKDGNDTINGGIGDDYIAGGNGLDRIFGFDGNDTIYGGPDNDSIFAGNGDDIVSGGSGDDVISANPGNDTVNGESGNDTIFGGGDDDTINGGAGNDTLYGQAGNDVVYGSLGDDTVNGGGGNDSLNGGDGADRLIGSAGNDVLRGGNQNDNLNGGSGDDSLLGDAGADTLNGFIGNDVLRGGDGNDTLRGWTGDDILFGDEGIDRFAFDDGWGHDTLRDFANDGQEKIDLRNIAAIDSIADLTITTEGNAARIAYDGNSILVTGLTAGDLDASDFLFSPSGPAAAMFTASAFAALVPEWDAALF